jgi:hypothetical protein
MKMGTEEVEVTATNTVSEGIVKFYRWLGKKRYLGGKYVYMAERLYLPIPSRLRNKVKPFLNQRLRMEIATQNHSLLIVLHPAKTFLHAESTPQKHPSKTGKNA